MRIAQLALLPLVACTARPPTVATPAAPVPVEVVHSSLDARTYAVLTLDNGLRALLVSDPDTDMAAAAMFVHAGHYADPADRQGLAHFLEHMLFMGTDRYPDVDGYRTFIEDHGGHTNAGTSGESTLYHFDVEHGAFTEAFDRFARFFVAPVLDPSYVERERKAVNSEYTLKLQDADRRGRQVRKVTTNPAHPESKFSVGNLDTLGDRDGDPVYEDLRALYGAEYSADEMTLAVIGREPIDVLQQTVRTALADAPRSTRGPETPRPPPFMAEQLGVRIDIVPLDVRREIELQFPLPPEKPFWPFHPIGYVTSIVGDEGEGTLFTALKDAGWIESLSAGIADPADDYDLMSVNIGLTEAGVAHIDDIVAATFAELRKIDAEGIVATRHEEERVMGSLGFRFAEENQPVDLVRSAAEALYEVPPEHVLDGWSLVGDLRPDVVRQMLAKTVPDNLRLLVTLPAGAGPTTDRREPLYDVPYGLRPLTTEERAAYAGEPPFAVGLPAANPYLPQNTDLVAGGAGPAVPSLLSADGARVELWHLLDTEFGVPRAFGTIELWTPAARVDLKSRVLVRLYTRMLEDALQAFQYPLSQAGQSFGVRGTTEGLELSFRGYDDRQAEVLRDLSQRIAKFEVDPERFAIERAQMVREWRNLDRERPLTQVRWAESEGVFPLAFDRKGMIPVAEALTVDEMRAFAKGFFATVGARVLIHGNVDATEARALASIVEVELLGDSPVAERPDSTVRLLPAGKTVVRDVAIDHDDSAIVVAYYSAKTDVPTQAKYLLLGQLLDTPFFTQLRTEQQLGYAVSAGYARYDQLPGVRFNIQSAVAGPVTLLERIDAFITDNQKPLAEMDPEAFATIRAGVVANLREKDTQLYARSAGFVNDLRDGILTFDGDEQLALAVEALDRDTMAAFYTEVLRSPEASRLVTRSFGRKHTAERPTGKGECADAACVAKKLPEVWRRVR